MHLTSNKPLKLSLSFFGGLLGKDFIPLQGLILPQQVLKVKEGFAIFDEINKDES